MAGVLNVFEPNAFTLQTLTSAINEGVYTPNQISALGLFNEQGIPNLDGLFESLQESINTIAVSARGSSGAMVELDKAKVRSLRIPHLSQRLQVFADEVQGVREFGTESNSRTVESVRNKKLEKARRQIDFTMELHRLEALKGNYYDANGTVQSAYTFFDAGSQDTVDLLLGTSTSNLRGFCEIITGHVEDGLRGLGYTGIGVMCSRALWRKLIDFGKFKEAYLNWQAANERIAGSVTKPFVFNEIEWHRYRGNSAVDFVAGDGYAFPMGTTEPIFQTRFAPADYVETVNTIGLPYYAAMEPMPLNKGYHGEAQSNPLNICVVPQAIVKVTSSN